MRILFLIGMLISLAGCAIPRVSSDYSFSKSNGKGVLAYSHEGIGAESSFQLRKVDMEKQRFVGETIRFSTCTGCLPYANTFKLENAYLPDFALLELDPGTYAFAGFRRGSYYFENNCRGTPIFRIKPGKINVVFQNVYELKDTKKLENFRAAAADFKNITADIVIAHTGKMAKFDIANEDGEACPFPHGAKSFVTISEEEYQNRKSINILD